MLISVFNFLSQNAGILDLNSPVTSPSKLYPILQGVLILYFKNPHCYCFIQCSFRFTHMFLIVLPFFLCLTSHLKLFFLLPKVCLYFTYFICLKSFRFCHKKWLNFLINLYSWRLKVICQFTENTIPMSFGTVKWKHYRSRNTIPLFPLTTYEIFPLSLVSAVSFYVWM